MDSEMGEGKMKSEILAFDPGKSIGWCRLVPPLEILESGTFHYKDYQTMTDLIRSLADVDTLVAEDFRLYPGKGDALAWDDLPAPQAIGMLKVITWQEPYPKQIEFLMPSSKQSVPTDLLEEMNIDWHTPHERDAIKLALFYSLFKMDYQQHEEVQEVLRRWADARKRSGRASRRSKL